MTDWVRLKFIDNWGEVVVVLDEPGVPGKVLKFREGETVRCRWPDETVNISPLTFISGFTPIREQGQPPRTVYWRVPAVTTDAHGVDMQVGLDRVEVSLGWALQHTTKDAQ